MHVLIRESKDFSCPFFARPSDDDLSGDIVVYGIAVQLDSACFHKSLCQAVGAHDASTIWRNLYPSANLQSSSLQHQVCSGSLRRRTDLSQLFCLFYHENIQSGFPARDYTAQSACLRRCQQSGFRLKGACHRPKPQPTMMISILYDEGPRVSRTKFDLNDAVCLLRLEWKMSERSAWLNL